MTTSNIRGMSFAVDPIADSANTDRWQWTVCSHPDRTVLRSGQIVGDRAKAERAARAAIALMGGTVQSYRLSQNA